MKYILDCTHDAKGDDTCTMVSYSPPPATVDHYALGPEWVPPLGAGVILAIVLAIAIVRYKAHEEKASVQRARINNPPKQCLVCGALQETEKEKL